MEIFYAPNFIRNLNSLPLDLQEEAHQKIELFVNQKNHKMLRVHKLKGSLYGRYSFSVNYKTRIVFLYTNKSRGKKDVVLLSIGSHDIYR